METIICVLLMVTVALARSGITYSGQSTQQEDASLLWQSGTAKNETVVDVIRVHNLPVFLDLISRAGLTKNLTEKGPFTVFAPTTQALNELPLSVRQKLLTSDEFAKEFVSSHLVLSKVTSKNMTQSYVVKTLNKTDVRFNKYQRGNKTAIWTANGVTFQKRDLLASNGVVHIVNKALWPQNHLNIMDLISSVRSLSSFASEITKAKVNLTGTGPYTVFAPSDKSFKGYSGKAKSVVKYHVTVDSITDFSAGLYDSQELTTMYKPFSLTTKLKIVVNSGQISVHGHSNSGNVVDADIPATNGVVHIIDAVLKPPLLV